MAFKRAKSEEKQESPLEGGGPNTNTREGIEDFIRGMDEALKERERKELGEIRQGQRRDGLSEKEVKKRRHVLDRWVRDKRRYIQKTKRLLMQGFMQAQQILGNLAEEKMKMSRLIEMRRKSFERSAFSQMASSMSSMADSFSVKPVTAHPLSQDSQQEPPTPSDKSGESPHITTLDNFQRSKLVPKKEVTYIPPGEIEPFKPVSTEESKPESDKSSEFHASNEDEPDPTPVLISPTGAQQKLRLE